MYNTFFSGTFDVAEIVTEAFVLFFVGLVLYLRREDRREGYPLEDDVTGRLEPSGSLFWSTTPKTFILPHGDGVVVAPDGRRDSAELKARRTARADGSPIEPVGDPLQAGIGPGSYAQRAKRPDRLMHGENKIAPLRASPGFGLSKKDANPIGMTAVGADGVAAGTVIDAWVDRTEFLVRYLEVKLASAGRSVLVPMPMAIINKGKKQVQVRALLGSQFAGAPALANPDEVTFDEEERVVAYFGGGLLYATPQRSEPYL